MIDVLCVTKWGVQPKGLEYIPGEINYLQSTAQGWGNSANSLLEKSTNDVVFLDDDIEILPSTFDLLEKYYDYADMFGFGLIGPCGSMGEWIQSSGQMLVKQNDILGFSGFDREPRALMLPCYVAHCGTCLCYIKRSVIDAGVRFPVWNDGIHQEDTAFCLSVWLAGLQCMRLPSAALHHGHPNGAGATKGADPEFHKKRQINMQHLFDFIAEKGVVQAVDDGRIPLRYEPVVRND